MRLSVVSESATHSRACPDNTDHTACPTAVWSSWRASGRRPSVRNVKISALDFTERDRVLEAPADGCPDDLSELRGVLLKEREWRRR